jgi:hypothetical protein
MARYQAKPIEVEAVQVAEVLMHMRSPGLSVVPPWIAEAIQREELVALHAPERLQLITKDGRRDGAVDDYLVRGTDDILSLMERLRFEDSYRRIHG